MRFVSGVSLAFALAFAIACGSGGGLAADEQFIYDSLKTDTQKIKDEIAKKENPYLTCAGAMSYAESLATVEGNAEVTATREEVNKLCTYEGPIMVLDDATAKAEAARQAQGADAVVSECFNADQSLAVDELNKSAKDDAKFKELLDRWNKACPQ